MNYLYGWSSPPPEQATVLVYSQPAFKERFFWKMRRVGEVALEIIILGSAWAFLAWSIRG